MSVPDWDGFTDKCREWARCSDSSELKHVVEFIADITDSVRFDFTKKCHGDLDSREILRDDIITSLEEFEIHIAELKKFVEEELKP